MRAAARKYDVLVLQALSPGTPDESMGNGNSEHDQKISPGDNNIQSFGRSRCRRTEDNAKKNQLKTMYGL